MGGTRARESGPETGCYGALPAPDGNYQIPMRALPTTGSSGMLFILIQDVHHRLGLTPAVLKGSDRCTT